ncbi:MAG TPA: hypothetical protein VKV23_10945 [Acidimicrobiales bacterium]|nr:hypothetical protein [Acidimicrobiales bacterium]
MASVIEVATKDCTALSDAELAEMADLCAGGSTGYEAGFLSKERDAWVLVTQARAGAELAGFAFSTLERIGGTPCLLLGVAAFAEGAPGEAAMRSVMHDLYRRAVLAFPDEDVLVGTRLTRAAAFDAYAGLSEVVPRPGHKPTGEERAWGRRLAKRFGAEGRLDDRAFRITGDGNVVGTFDYGPASAPDELGALFAGLEPARRDTLVAFGWAMAEDLAAGSLPA